MVYSYTKRTNISGCSDSCSSFSQSFSDGQPAITFRTCFEVIFIVSSLAGMRQIRCPGAFLRRYTLTASIVLEDSKICSSIIASKDFGSVIQLGGGRGGRRRRAR